jgi:RNA polymerase sigma factor (sigma-70 family)
MIQSLWAAERDQLVASIQRRHGLTIHDAEDVVSEAFTRMVEERSNDPRRLQRKADSLAVDLWRRAYRADVPLVDVNAPDSLEGAELRADLTRAIGRLPLPQRQAFGLVEMRGLTLQEAGDAIGLKKSIVHERLQAARDRLREELEAT